MASRTPNLIAIAAVVLPISIAQVTTVEVDQITNWPAPLYWQPASTHPAEPVHHGRIREQVVTKAAAATLGTPAVFVAMSPCRVMDTRYGTTPPTGPFGAPTFTGGEIRTVAIPSGPCAVPSNAVAYSLNIAVVPSPAGSPMRWLTAWDTGDPQPTAATLNDKAGLITSNSAVVPAGTSGSIDIFVTDPTDVIVDINGYYALPSDLVGNTAFGIDALMNNTTGSNNTANGNYALQNNTTGSGNTANGAMALQSNSTGIDNTATGYLALFHNTTGNNNTATGEQALIFNTTGSSNVADGLGALTSNTTGSANTATGAFALWNNTTGGGNTATGENALTNNTTGIDNTACGAEALTFNTTGNNNIAVGHSAAYNVLSINSNNIHVGSEGSAADNGAIRIGTAGTQTSFFEAGVRGVTTSNPDAIPVIIDSAGQLGTASSSRRVKRDIEDMGDTTDTILALHPVRFHYQAHGFNSPLQYGLIAEEVAEIAPDLVARNKDGEIETVYYDKVNAMLLNEVQKLHREKDGLADAVRSLADTVRTLESRLAAVEDKAKYATSPSFAARTRPRFEPVAIPVGDTLARPELFACADAYPE